MTSLLRSSTNHYGPSNLPGDNEVGYTKPNRKGQCPCDITDDVTNDVRIISSLLDSHKHDVTNDVRSGHARGYVGGRG